MSAFNAAPAPAPVPAPIAGSEIKIHNVPFPDGVDIEKDPGQEYGILEIKAGKASICTSPILFIFTTDCSGSMGDRCKDGRTKMEHIKHTLSNMLRFFAESEGTNIFVRVDAFDDRIHPVISTTRVTMTNLAELLTAVDRKMYPMQSTNIELALKNASANVLDYLDENPEHSVSHIFMTDGEATSGNPNPDYLASLVSDVASNTFIAFGLSHSVETMQKLGLSNKNSSNWLIDRLEDAGLVYGEILNNELFKAIDKVEIFMTGALIYDYKKGAFVDKLYIGSLATEVKKVYHILVANRFDLEAQIIGVNGDKTPYSETTDCIPDLIDEDGNVYPYDLTNQIYRLYTQQLMFEARLIVCDDFSGVQMRPFVRSSAIHRSNALTRQNAIPAFNGACDEDEDEDEENCPASSDTKAEPKAEPKAEAEAEPKAEPALPQTPLEIFRNKLNTFLEIMQKYMKENGKEEDPFMKSLCDDIYITARSLGTRKQHLCVNARESSQGRQQCYNVTDFDLDSVQTHQNIASYSLGRSSTNVAYQTPSAVKMMRTCSAPIKNISSDEELEVSP